MSLSLSVSDIPLYPAPEQIHIQKIYTQMGVSDEEYEHIVAHLNGRLPNYTELGIFSVLWSEHCSYKNTKLQLKKFPTQGKYVLQGPGEGAGVIDIGDNMAVVFKIESHNHPSAIEPYQGAATGVGGIIRDIFSMGARPIACLNSLRFGELNNARTRYLFEQVVKGIAGYGNCVGVPTVGGEIYFDEAYSGNPLVNVMCVGLLQHQHLQKGIAKGIGNAVMYVGAATGKDGIHGATFASEELSEKSEAKRPAVQIGDPFMEKLLIEACLEVIHHPAVVGMQDMGAAGLSCSSAEMASKGDVGIVLNLDLVPQREQNMSAYEMMLSESQERMLLVVEKGAEADIAAMFHKWDLYAVKIGEVIEEKVLRLLHRNEIVAEMPVHGLVKDAPVYQRQGKAPVYFAQNCNSTYIPDIADNSVFDIWKQLLAQPTIASKRYVFEQYDYMVQTNTVGTPASSDASIVRIRGTQKALALTVDGNARYVYLNPEIGGKIAVAEAVRNIIASGAVPIGVSDGLNYGSPENPEIFWQLEQSVNGMAAACRAFEVPVIGGNVSLYNERSNSGAVLPTPIIAMVGLIEDTAHITTQKVKNAGDSLYIIGTTRPEFGGSELQKMLQGHLFGACPQIDLNEALIINHCLTQAIRRGIIRSAHDVSEGGIAVSLAEKLFGSGLGAQITIPCHSTQERCMLLFSESQNRYLVSVAAENIAAFEQLFGDKAACIGQVSADAHIAWLQEQVEIAELYKAWSKGLEQQLHPQS